MPFDRQFDKRSWCIIRYNKAGCPVFSNAGEPERLAENYFSECEGTPLLDENGQIVRDKQFKPVFDGSRPPTMSGLALALGFPDRKSLLGYRAKPQVQRIISRAMSRVQANMERLLLESGWQGTKFLLQSDFPGYDGHDGGDDGEIQMLIKGLSDD
ncbi:MAG: hypothetical protein IKS19_03305 [Clostridia bacterium]|nr:hypothetical protein [Clostridia bacterium]